MISLQHQAMADKYMWNGPNTFLQSENTVYNFQRNQKLTLNGCKKLTTYPMNLSTIVSEIRDSTRFDFTKKIKTYSIFSESYCPLKND